MREITELLYNLSPGTVIYKLRGPPQDRAGAQRSQSHDPAEGRPRHLHVEMDHSGSLPEVIAEVQPEKLIYSKMGQKALLQHFHREDWPYQARGDQQKRPYLESLYQ